MNPSEIAPPPAILAHAAANLVGSLGDHL